MPIFKIDPKTSTLEEVDKKGKPVNPKAKAPEAVHNKKLSEQNTKPAKGADNKNAKKEEETKED